MYTKIDFNFKNIFNCFNFFILQLIIIKIKTAEKYYLDGKGDKQVI